MHSGVSAARNKIVHVPREIEVPRESPLAAAIQGCWPGARVLSITPIKGDASNRRFWRLALDGAEAATPKTVVAMDLGPDDLPLYARALNLFETPPEEPPWLNLHRFLKAIGAAVPKIHASDLSARLLIVEDVGEISLFAAAARGNGADLYRLSIDELLLLHVNGTLRIGEDCLAARIAYDRRLFRWELDQFLEFGMGGSADAAQTRAIIPELDELAARLDRFPRVFSHRDYHGGNLFVQTGANGKPRLRVIDFQDALMAPATQDLAVLLTTRDAARVVTPGIERRLLGYYYAGLIRLGAASLSFDDFMESYRLCVIQHALKTIGRFTLLERQGKSGYSGYIPYAIAQARRMLTQKNDLPTVDRALGI